MVSKRFFVFLFACFLVSNFCYSQEYIRESKKLGLISYLTTVKSFVEFKMISLAQDEQYKKQPEKAKDFRAQYNGIKLLIDRLINQLSADMLSTNRLKAYNELNDYVKDANNTVPDKFSGYLKLLEEIDGATESFMIKSYSSMLAGPSLADITGVAELVHTAITDARDFREKKIQSTITILEKTRLEKLKDLTEEKKKDE